MKEQVASFGSGASLTGVVSAPSGGAAHTGVLICNAGLLHRVGPHRLHVKLARRLAEAGCAVMRFDLSGIGDSGSRRDDLPIEKSAVVEAREAMDYLERHHHVRRFYMMGICSGAIVSFQTAREDDRVVGVVLVNAQAHHGDEGVDEVVAVRQEAKYFWRRSVGNPKSWLKALTGKVDYKRNVAMLVHQVKEKLTGKAIVTQVADVDVGAALRELGDRKARVLLVYSQDDPGLALLEALDQSEFERLKGVGSLSVEVVDGADHIFTPGWCQEKLMTLATTWVGSGGIA